MSPAGYPNRMRASMAIVVGAMALIPVTLVQPAIAQTENDDVIVGTLRYTERGPGASYDGIANAIILSLGTPAVVEQMGGAVALVFDILQNPVLVDAMGTDMQSITDELRGNLPVTELPIRASYDALIRFQLRDDGDGLYQLEDGSISWSTDNTTSFSADETRLTDSFHGEGIEALDPTTDQINLTFSTNAAGEVVYTFDIDVTHGYSTIGSSEWSTPIASIALERDRGNVTIEGITPFGSTSTFMPPLPLDLFEDQTKTVGYIRTATLESPDSALASSETWTNLFGGSQVAQLQAEPLACNPTIDKPDPARLVFDESTEGEIKDRAELYGVPLALSDGLHWIFPEHLPVTATYVPDDRKGESAEFIWKKLPEASPEFGKYYISVEYETDTLGDLCPEATPLAIEVFYPIDAKNNPGGKDYNWFYYWMQTSATSGIGDIAVAEQETCQGELGHYTEGAEIIYVCHPVARSRALRLADGAFVGFIDTFAITVIHEDQHRQNWNEWWGLKLAAIDLDGDGLPDERPGYVVDTDGDRVPDEWEVKLGLDPHDPFSCRLYTLLHEELREDLQGKEQGELMEALGITDYECPSYRAELRWQVGSARSEDWASPGSQFGDAAP